MNRRTSVYTLRLQDTGMTEDAARTLGTITAVVDRGEHDAAAAAVEQIEGVTLGRWKDLPQDIQAYYAPALDLTAQAVVRSARTYGPDPAP